MEGILVLLTWLTLASWALWRLWLACKCCKQNWLDARHSLGLGTSQDNSQHLHYIDLYSWLLPYQLVTLLWALSTLQSCPDDIHPWSEPSFECFLSENRLQSNCQLLTTSVLGPSLHLIAVYRRVLGILPTSISAAAPHWHMFKYPQ